MRIQIASDIHYERFPIGGKPPIDIVGDILILAGDLSDCPKCFMAFLDALKPTIPVFLVLGNHEHYFVGMDSAVAVFNDIAKRYRNAPITILTRFTTETINGVDIIGDTMWTDYARGTHMQVAMENMWELYRGHMGGNLDADRIRLWHTYMEHRLQFVLENRNKDNKLVVVSHHSPSFQCCELKFMGDRMNGAFHSNMDELIVEHQPDLWVFGHIHTSVDMVIGETRVIANPFGYLGYQTNSRYCTELTVEV